LWCTRGVRQVGWNTAAVHQVAGLLVYCENFFNRTAFLRGKLPFIIAIYSIHHCNIPLTSLQHTLSVQSCSARPFVLHFWIPLTSLQHTSSLIATRPCHHCRITLISLQLTPYITATHPKPIQHTPYITGTYSWNQFQELEKMPMKYAHIIIHAYVNTHARTHTHTHTRDRLAASIDVYANTQI